MAANNPLEKLYRMIQLVGYVLFCFLYLQYVYDRMGRKIQLRESEYFLSQILQRCPDMVHFCFVYDQETVMAAFVSSYLDRCILIIMSVKV